MLITPTQKDLVKWMNAIPVSGDLLFFGNGFENLDLPVPILTTEQVRTQAVEIWKLNDRSWYGYALNGAKYASWFPNGEVEKLDPKLQRRIVNEQIRIKVPTLVQSKLLPRSLRNKTLTASGHCWLTSALLCKLDRREKVDCLKAWLKQNEVVQYQRVDIQHLSKQARGELRRLGLTQVVNQFSKSSGPNCFGAVAGAISPSSQRNLLDQWVHWQPLAELLSKRGYSATKLKTPERGDVLVFLSRGRPVHAAYALDEDVYFEKPGQDFYEPYRLARFEDWKQEWKGSKLQIYRKLVD